MWRSSKLYLRSRLSDSHSRMKVKSSMLRTNKKENGSNERLFVGLYTPSPFVLNRVRSKQYIFKVCDLVPICVIYSDDI